MARISIPSSFLPGFTAKRDFNIKMNIQKKEKEIGRLSKITVRKKEMKTGKQHT